MLLLLVDLELIPEVIESAEVSLYSGVERRAIKSTCACSGGKHSYSNGPLEQSVEGSGSPAREDRLRLLAIPEIEFFTETRLLP